MKKAGILLLLLLVSFFIYTAFINRAKGEIIIALNQYAGLVAAGNPAAANYLVPNLQNNAALLAAMGTPSLFLLDEIAEPKLHSLSRATVTLSITVGQKWTEPIVAELVKTKDGWKIDSFPQLIAAPIALLQKVSAETATFLLRDGQVITLASSSSSTTANNNLEESVGKAGFLVGIGGRIVLFTQFHQTLVPKLLTVTEEKLEGEAVGIFPLAAEAAFFRRQGEGYRIAASNEFIVGMQNLTFFKKDGEIIAVLLPEDFVPHTIRVAINSNGFAGLGHREIILTADTSFLLEDKVAGISWQFMAGQQLVFSAEGNKTTVTLPSGERQQFQNRVYFIARGDRIRVKSLQRGNPAFTPTYYGQMEMTAIDGQVFLVNELPLENYLYYVVPSEMPVSFGLTPLKVQAVAARSYAVSSILRSGFRRFAAHVDDSTASQVYNNIPKQEISTKAIRETAGIVVSYQGKIADTRFFSTSSGVTANFAETWHDPQTGDFPANSVPYLVYRPQLNTGTLPDVSSEDGARSFFTSTAWDVYDKSSPWFRWAVEMSGAELTAVINSFLPERQKAQPSFVLTRVGNTWTELPIPDNPLGELKDLRVIRRGAGGNIMELEIEGTSGSFRLIKEYTIRFTLRPIRVDGERDIILWRHHEPLLRNYPLLPSSFMVIDLEHDSQGRVTTVRFRGGGNGHGVGMSQWGARELGAKGLSYEEILLHYYLGTTLEKLY